MVLTSPLCVHLPPFRCDSLGADVHMVPSADVHAEDRCIPLEGEFQDKGKLIESNSVDLVFVDSTYFENTLPLHGPLAEVTERILRDGGSYAVYLVPQWKQGLIRKYISDNSNLNECGRWIALMQGSFGSDYPHRMMYQSKDIGMVL